MKNINNMEVVKGQEVICDFAEILEDNPDVLFLDYSDLESMPVGGTIRIKDVVLKVKETSIEQTILTVDTPGTIFGGEYVRFLDFTPTLPYLTQKDKKDLAW